MLVVHDVETVPIPVSVVESENVTFSQVGFVVRLHPGLVTVATKGKVSVVPIVAVVGVMVMAIPVTIVNEAEAVFVVSACDVAVTVAVGAATVVPLDVVVGSVAGAW